MAKEIVDIERVELGDIDPVEEWEHRKEPVEADGRGVYRKLVALTALCGRVKKDKENTFHRYKYASDEAVMAVVNPGLVDVGLAAFPVFSILTSETLTEQTKDGFTVRKGELVKVQATITLLDPDDGSWFRFTALGSGTDAGDKAVMKAETAAHKYAWMKLLCMSTGDDPEADSSTDARTAKPVQMPQAKKEAVSASVAR